MDICLQANLLMPSNYALHVLYEVKKCKKK